MDKNYNEYIFKYINGNVSEEEAKELEKTNPQEAIKKYEYLNEIRPGLKKYSKRIEIIERTLE